MGEELFYMIHDYTGEQIEETLEIVNSIKDNKNIINELVAALEDYCEDLSICPKCGSDLLESVYTQNSEYFGFSVNEQMKEVVCENCGWSRS